ncbi:phosphopantetheine-binding protein (plasmid) [Streptomyces viridifaciens]|nr:phosphopantetheine-binding protein [Streptomyces viridifaciens]
MTHKSALPETPAIAAAVDEHPEIVEFRYVDDIPGANPMVVAKTTGFLGGSELRRYCRERGGSAEFDVLVVDEMPKPDISAADLRSLAEQAQEGAFSAFATPQGPVETALVEMWERLLEFAPISVLDDFVELGGDSLIALEVAVEISQTWGRNLSLVDLIDASSIRRLARILDTTTDGSR